MSSPAKSDEQEASKANTVELKEAINEESKADIEENKEESKDDSSSCPSEDSRDVSDEEYLQVGCTMKTEAETNQLLRDQFVAQMARWREECPEEASELDGCKRQGF